MERSRKAGTRAGRRNTAGLLMAQDEFGPAAQPTQVVGKVHVGVIGCGYWGPQLIRNFYDLPTGVVSMVADLSLERRAYVERQFPGVPTTSDYQELLNDPEIDAVVVATPIGTHFQLAKRALVHGKHVLVEKPLATTVTEAEELVDLAEKHNRRLMVGHTFEYNPAVHELGRLVRDGVLGNIRYIDAARLNLGLLQRDSNVIWDLAPHDISILLYILDQEPLTVRATGNGYVRPRIQEVAYLDLLFPDGVMAHVHVSWLEPCKVRRVTVVGANKMAVYNDVSVEEKIKIYDKGVSYPEPTGTFGEFQLSYRYGDITSPHVPWHEPLRSECSHFVDCIRFGTQPQSDGWSGLRVVRILEAANKSLMLGGLQVSVATGAVADVVSFVDDASLPAEAAS